MPQAPSIRWILNFSDLLLVTPLCFLALAAAIIFLAGEHAARSGTQFFIFECFSFPLSVFFPMPNQ